MSQKELTEVEQRIAENQAKLEQARGDRERKERLRARIERLERRRALIQAALQAQQGDPSSLYGLASSGQYAYGTPAGSYSPPKPRPEPTPTAKEIEMKIPRQTIRQRGEILYTIAPGAEPGSYTQTFYGYKTPPPLPRMWMASYGTKAEQDPDILTPTPSKPTPGASKTQYVAASYGTTQEREPRQQQTDILDRLRVGLLYYEERLAAPATWARGTSQNIIKRSPLGAGVGAALRYGAGLYDFGTFFVRPKKIREFVVGTSLLIPSTYRGAQYIVEHGIGPAQAKQMVVSALREDPGSLAEILGYATAPYVYSAVTPKVMAGMQRTWGYVKTKAAPLNEYLVKPLSQKIGSTEFAQYMKLSPEFIQPKAYTPKPPGTIDKILSEVKAYTSTSPEFIKPKAYEPGPPAGILFEAQQYLKTGPTFKAAKPYTYGPPTGPLFEAAQYMKLSPAFISPRPYEPTGRPSEFMQYMKLGVGYKTPRPYEPPRAGPFDEIMQYLKQRPALKPTDTTPRGWAGQTPEQRYEYDAEKFFTSTFTEPYTYQTKPPTQPQAPSTPTAPTTITIEEATALGKPIQIGPPGLWSKPYPAGRAGPPTGTEDLQKEFKKIWQSPYFKTQPIVTVKPKPTEKPRAEEKPKPVPITIIQGKIKTTATPKPATSITPTHRQRFTPLQRPISLPKQAPAQTQPQTQIHTPRQIIYLTHQPRLTAPAPRPFIYEPLRQPRRGRPLTMEAFGEVRKAKLITPEELLKRMVGKKRH